MAARFMRAQPEVADEGLLGSEGLCGDSPKSNVEIANALKINGV